MEYMAARMDDQITGAINENESLRDQVAALEAKVATLRAALVGLFGSGVLDEHDGGVMGADCHICDAVNAAGEALEATK